MPQYSSSVGNDMDRLSYLKDERNFGPDFRELALTLLASYEVVGKTRKSILNDLGISYRISFDRSLGEGGHTDSFRALENHWGLYPPKTPQEVDIQLWTMEDYAAFLWDEGRLPESRKLFKKILRDLSLSEYDFVRVNQRALDLEFSQQDTDIDSRYVEGLCTGIEEFIKREEPTLDDGDEEDPTPEQLHPANIVVYYYEGRLYQSEGDDESAFRFYDAAIDSWNTHNDSEFFSVCCQALRYRSSLSSRRGKFMDALNDLIDLSQLEKGSIPEGQDSPELAIIREIILEMIGSLLEQMSLLLRTAKEQGSAQVIQACELIEWYLDDENCKRVITSFLRARCAQLSKDMKNAEVRYLEVLRRGIVESALPDHFSFNCYRDALSFLVSIYRDQKKFDKALEHQSELLELLSAELEREEISDSERRDLRERLRINYKNASILSKKLGKHDDADNYGRWMAHFA
jgi:tetratricopeptide (TPR) repeat protein